jgi:hypothetical protein
MSHKNFAIGIAIILFSMLSLIVFLTTSYAALQAINPIAALTAITVAIIGLVWFKKQDLQKRR